MDVTVHLGIRLHIVDEWPRIRLSVDDQIIHHTNYKYRNKTEFVETFKIPNLKAGAHSLRIEYLNNREFTTQEDMAVEITSVRFQHLDNDFKHLSVYRPEYPEGFAEQDPEKWTPEIHSNYLGWNGEWSLEFETPIYRWLHGQLNMGWLI